MSGRLALVCMVTACAVAAAIPADLADRPAPGALVFLLLANDADGAQHVRAAVPMPEAACLPLQAAIWREPSPVAYTDPEGLAVPVLDAACVPADQWAGEVANGARVEVRP